MYSDGGGADASMFAGGGFMPSQSQPTTEYGGGGAGVGYKGGSANSGLLPLTVKMISQAVQKPSDDNFYIDGLDVNNVTLIGMVHDKDERTTDINFRLDDGTGQIEVKRWIDGQESHDMQEMQSIENFAYVRVHGHLRSFQGKRNVVAFSVRPITDFNEITFHFLEVIYVHLLNRKAQGANATAAPGATPGTASTYGVQSAPLANSNRFDQYTAPVAPAGTGGGSDSCQKRVHQIFEDPASLAIEQGLHVEEVARKMVGYTKQQVREAIEFLVNEGFIYSTIDDDHYKSTTA